MFKIIKIFRYKNRSHKIIYLAKEESYIKNLKFYNELRNQIENNILRLQYGNDLVALYSTKEIYDHVNEIDYNKNLEMAEYTKVLRILKKKTLTKLEFNKVLSRIGKIYV